MPKRSAGLLVHRRRGSVVEVFLIHPGGPLWASKDDGAWSLPKGLVAPGEDELLAARREFLEETGFVIDGSFDALGEFQQPSGKVLNIWTVEGDCAPENLISNTFEMVWPPSSGKVQAFPEADRGAWFGKDTALRKITKGQKPIIDRFFALGA